MILASGQNGSVPALFLVVDMLHSFQNSRSGPFMSPAMGISFGSCPSGKRHTLQDTEGVNPVYFPYVTAKGLKLADSARF